MTKVTDAGLVEDEDVLGQDLLVLDAEDLGDIDDLPRTVLEASRMDDQVDGGRDLFADRPEGHLIARHQDHRLESTEHVFRRVGVAGR